MYQIIEYIASGLLMVVTPVLFVKLVLKQNIKISKIKTIIIMLIFLVAYMISQLFLEGLIKTIINCIIHIIILKKIYNIDYWKTVLIVMLFAVMMILTEGIVISTSILIFKIDKLNFYAYYAGSLILNTAVCITFLIIANFIKNYIRKILNYKLDTNKQLVILLIMVAICIFLCFYKAFNNFELNKDFYVSIGIIMIFLVVLISLIYQLIINNKKTLEYDKLLDFMKTYEEEIEKQKILRHETKNQLLTIKAKIYDKEKDNKVIKYIDSILDEKIEVSQEHYAKFQYLPGNGLKALFYFKTQEAEKKGIKVSINVSERVKNSVIYHLKTNDFKQLGRLLGIYLDNAIEASESSELETMGIEIYMISNNIEIIISNSYEDTKEKVSKNGKSTKGKNRGHGLLFARSIINSSKLFEESKIVNDKYYTQKLIIKKSSHC